MLAERQTKDEVLAELMAEHVALKKSLGSFDQELGAIRASKFYDWRQRYGRVNEHNGWIPRDFWLEPA
jgi:hypothetical protein